jgi:uncharacterized protein YecE (DUF72 family)
MATRYHIAAKSLRGDIASYSKRFDLLEVPVVAAEELRLMPSTQTLKRWRKAVPPHFEFAVIAGPTMARLRGGDAAQKEHDAFTHAQDVLEARIVVVKTPAEVTPSAVWRDRMKAFCDGIRRDAVTIVWEPAGLWEIEESTRFAKKIDIVVGVDAARDKVPDGPVAYTRLRALGETRSFGPAALERVARNVGDRRDAYVVIETDSALAECKALRKAAVRVRQGQRGGMGRLLRPRAHVTLVTHDDEQE